jgi:hypothetical protein
LSQENESVAMTDQDSSVSLGSASQSPAAGPNPFTGLPSQDDPLRVGRWTREQAADWYAARPWIVGCNYIPGYAANQLEMWQAETFDPEAIAAELDLAASIGFNTVRVFLHDLLWTNPDGLLSRLDHFLEIADRRGIASMPVFFEGVWNNYAQLGPQPEPIPGVHNSQWVQSPNAKAAVDPAQWQRLEDYMSGILDRFADDDRVLMWDIYNEPGNEGLITNALPLLDAAFRWARSIGVDQPITSAIWEITSSFHELNRFQLLSSDIITFHHYLDVNHLEWLIRSLRLLGRPMICTEYMARTNGSTFRSHLPAFQAEDVGCLNWGLVNGRTQTQYAWDSPRDAEEPQEWFHDVFRVDHTPYDIDEVDFIRRTCEAVAKPAASAK